MIYKKYICINSCCKRNNPCILNFDPDKEENVKEFVGERVCILTLPHQLGHFVPLNTDLIHNTKTTKDRFSDIN